MPRRQRLLRWSLTSVVAIVAISVSAPVAAADPLEFPQGYTGYHTYAEMVADIDAVVAAHQVDDRRVYRATAP